MTDRTCENGIKWRALHPFGVELDHDLTEPLAGPTAERFLALFRDAGLILARGQALAMADQVRLTAMFGPIIRRPQENGYISTETGPRAGRTPLTFHSDAGYTTAPFAALSLHATDVVDGASSTRFANAERGYAILPAELRQRLTARSAEMLSPTLDGVALRACDVPNVEATTRMPLPPVLVNPRTGRNCIRVSEMHTARLVDMPWEESRAVLSAVYDYLYAPGNTTEHVWTRGDFVIWDNVTFHHARGSLAGVGRRVLQRAVAGA